MLHDSSDSTSYHSNDWHANIRFETYSDARLAAVFLDNMDRLPVDLFKQVIDVIIDPQFKSSEVTFKGTLDAFERVSTYRRNMAPGCTVERLSSGVVPPVVLDLVVDTIVQQNIPLGIAAEKRWSDALAHNGVSLRNMSLVHRSWTIIAQRGLRHRAIIPCRQIHRFLVNPLCGPWVTEMIIYWTLRPKDEAIRRLYLLEGLLERTPNVCSLAFITSYDGSESKKAESFQIQSCFDTISGLLPCLRRLWLKHITNTCGSVWVQVCENLNSVCKAIPKLHSLEFLSIDRWVSSDLEDFNWNEHPPSSLKSISLCLHDFMSRQFFAWLLSPRNGFSLQWLSIGEGDGCPESSYRELLLSLQSNLHQLNHLSAVTWAIQHDDRWSSSDNILLTCRMLTSLELIYDQCYSPRCSSSFLPALPPSLTHLTFRCPDVFLHKSAHAFALRIVQSLKKKIPTLPQLQSLLFIIHPHNPLYSSLVCQGRDSRRYDTQLGGRFVPAEELVVADLTDFCNSRNIHLACVQAPSLALLG
ncbi:uncharacterized protein FOMMEDRAFT_154391 [Fomitiporia mediterranea MF3/22]|uniref:uncharacterized protein n=1 Tax=Fomitiporia mediterranea (strain MF3/22) TaxID=694068 RepID=UPI0004408356|nr:uncharacterized protein FOMMEDRAFT_154391 [Fomitiporia mediterranea MF3/22]EJD05178.1 hypothetical protein FOMMEDRAFT_154391 [Fomitiporia mediterranea MF3/22]